MWLKKLKRRKVQFILVGLVIFVAAGLLNLCLSFSAELAAFSNKAINRENCPDAYILTEGTKNFADHFVDGQWKDKVEDISALTGTTITAPVQYRKKDITQLHDMALAVGSIHDFGYLTLQAGGGKLNAPQKGEVWLSETLTTPNNIKPGDTITLRYVTPMELTVTGIYRSTCFPKAVGWSPMLVSEEDAALMPGGADAAIFAVNIKDYSNVALKALFENSTYSIVTRTRDDAQASLMEYSGSLGAIGAMAAIVVFIVTLVIMRFIVRSNLLREFKNIGVYKSLGFTSKDISHIFLNGYLLVGAAGIILGSFSALFLVGAIGRYCTEYVDGFKAGLTSLLLSCAVILVFTAILYLNLLLALKKVKRITPVEAITIGNTRLEQKLPPSLIRSAKSPISSAVNEMIKYKKSTLLLLLTITASVFLSLFFAMIWTSSDQMLRHANLWFNLPRSDAYVTGDIRNELKDFLSESKYVKSSVYGDFGNDQVKVEGYPTLINYVRYDTYSTLDRTVTGIQMTAGQAPEGTDEIAAGENLLRLLGLKVGDTITLTLHDTTREYLVSGAYATVADGGRKIMMTTDAVMKSMEYKSNRAFIRLHSQEEYEAFKQTVESHFGGIAVDTSWFAMENSVESIRGMLKSVSFVLVAAFMVFSILNIIIVLLLEHKNSRRKYGILKSLGFSTGMLIRQSISKYFILAVAGSAAALILHLTFSQKLGAALLIDAFVNSSLLLASLAAGFIILILSATFFISLSLKQITPVELMEE